MKREQVMSVLYDIALVIGSEISVRPLLTKTVQRLLYHTSFPTGLVFLDLSSGDGGESIQARLDAAVGDFGFSRLVGQTLEVPAALMHGAAEIVTDSELLHALPGATRGYGVCLRLPIGAEGVMLLLAPEQPRTELPLTDIFQPVMANLAKSVLLCRHNDAFTSALMAERDMAQRSQAESEEKFCSITTVAPDAIVMIDDQGCLAYWNPAAERMFGYQAEHVLGRKAHQLIAPVRYHETFKKGFASFVASGTGKIIGKTLEIEACRRDGSEFPVELSVSSLRLNDHWHAVGILRDISARKQAEMELVKSQQNLAEAQTVAQIGNWELDLENDDLYWSDVVYEIFEIDKEKFGASYGAFLDAIHPADREKVDKAYTDSVERHDYYEVNHRLLMPDGRIKYLQERGRSYYDEHGKALRSIGTVQEITRMHEVEEQLRQAQKMEAVGTLVGGIAHDFNNKLAAITGNLYLAQEAIEGNSEAMERLKAVEELSFEAASMVQQLLTFARKGKVEQAPLTLVSFIKEAAKLYRVAVPESIQLSIDYGKDPLPVMGDIIQLQQVFLNLLTNARDALERTSEPRIDVALLHYEPDAVFRAEHPESEGIEAYACLRVADNGCGIAPEHLGQIFDPFFTTKEQGKGTGLGLAMLYGVIQAHQGIVEVSSASGRGTTFSIYLPLHPEVLQMQEEAGEEKILHGDGELLLIADDDANVLAVMHDLLSSLGYRVLTARDGVEAVDLYREHRDEVALVLLDIVMPRLKGPDAARLIRDINPGVKLLYATGYDSGRNVHESGRDAEVLEKPYRVQEVGHILHDILHPKGS